jgi:prepilin-type processing-associated H-X9-DG protein
MSNERTPAGRPGYALWWVLLAAAAGWALWLDVRMGWGHLRPHNEWLIPAAALGGAAVAGVVALLRRLPWPWQNAALWVLGALLVFGLPVVAYLPGPPDLRKNVAWYVSWLIIGGCVINGLPLLAVLVAWYASRRMEAPWQRMVTSGLAFLTLVTYAGLVGPLFARSPRPNPCQDSCISNVKQLCLGMMIYAADHDDCLPPARGWAGRVFPYVKNKHIYLCPLDDRWSKQKCGDLSDSYTINLHAGGLRLRPVATPGELVLLFDGTECAGFQGAAAYRHREGLNAGYADGHCKWVAQSRFTNELLSPVGLTAARVRSAQELPPLAPDVPRTLVESQAESARRALQPAQVQALQRLANMPPERAAKKLTAHLKLTAPAEIWTGDAYLLTAEGSYDLPPDLARAILAGRMRLDERYSRGNLFGSGRQLGADDSHLVLLARPDLGGDFHVTNTMTYIVGVAPVEAVWSSAREKYAKAEATATSRYRQFRVRLREPTEGSRFLTRVGDLVSFRGEYSLDEGGIAKPTVRWTWRFGDGATAEGFAATHVYARPGSYWAVGRAASGVHRLEVWLPVCVLSRFGIWPRYLLPSSGPQWSAAYQMKAPGNWP